MAYVGYFGFLGYSIPLWLLTGTIILRVDVQAYKLAGMDKERKVCRFIGWLNVCLGLLMFAGYWLLQWKGW
ncbi:CLC_0170 family protein [Paenibacillus piri]|uniref:Uncharacterized protein n=1 Tax=Paenibacillus piri TaxID=2547395 RepID=A0A4R5KWR4_9BACL|nr:CLC_0170 family protein [Paenibacillus piri]TDF99477.1 hypothetical protein E1757_06405 [Paenibacillus piri]